MIHIKLPEYSIVTDITNKYALELIFQQLLFLQYAPSLLFAIHKTSIIPLKFVAS
jgi:hypothetical protein